MAWDLAFDPLTGDFVRDGAGGWVRTETGDTAVLHQLRVHFAAWWGDDAIGSLLHERERFARDPAPLVAGETRRALGLLVDEQFLADVTVAASETRTGRIDGRTTYRLVQSGQAVDLALPRLGG
jgi:phage gp46-like protein